MSILRISLLGAILAMSGAGCASLASTTGPMAAGGHWSAATRQMVHVGEEVEFDFVLLNAFGRKVSPTGRADYVVVSVGERNLSSEPDEWGRFRFAHRFDDVEPGQEIDVTAEAYLQRGARDYILVGNTWHEADSTYDTPDKRVARDRLRLTSYRTHLALAFPSPPSDLDATTGVLKLVTADERTSSIFADTPLRRGYLLEGPGNDGYYQLVYDPEGDEVGHFGDTRAVFRVYDITGAEYSFETTIETP